jgi:hypothetical protein
MPATKIWKTYFATAPKHGRSLWPVVTAHTVVYHGRAAVLVIAHDAVPTRALAPSSPASAMRPDVENPTFHPI